MQAAPMRAIEALWGESRWLFLILSMMFSATIFPITPEGMPVRGAVGKMASPLTLLRGCEIGCGTAKAIPAAKIFGKAGLS